MATPTPADESAENSPVLVGSTGAAAESAYHRASALTFADVRRLADAGDARAAKALHKFIKGGARGGARSAADAATLFEREVPAFNRGSPSAIADFLEGKDVSHVQARAKLLREGVKKRVADGASNVKIENHVANQARGAKDMTSLERIKSDLVNNTAAVRSAAAVGAVVAGGVAAASHGQAVIDGRESVEEAGKAVLSSAAGGAASGAALAVVSVLCPPAGVVMGVAAIGSLGLAAARALTPSVAAAARTVAPEFVEQGEAFADAVGKRVDDTANAVGAAAETLGVRKALGAAERAREWASRSPVVVAATDLGDSLNTAAGRVLDATRVSTATGYVAVGVARTVGGISDAATRAGVMLSLWTSSSDAATPGSPDRASADAAAALASEEDAEWRTVDSKLYGAGAEGAEDEATAAAIAAVVAAEADAEEAAEEAAEAVWLAAACAGARATR